MDQQQFEQIEAYLQQRMTAPERAAFQQQLQEDPELRAQMEKQLELMNAIETEALKSRLERIHEKQFAGGKAHRTLSSSKALKPLSIAASLALLILAGWWIIQNDNTSSSSLYSQYYERPAGLPTTLGMQEDPRFEEGMVDYKLGDFAEAQRQWLSILESSSSSDTLLFFLGITYLETSQLDSAIIQLQTVQAQSGPYQDSAAWYLALAYLNAGRTEESRGVLQELVKSPGELKDRAQDLLSALQ